MLERLGIEAVERGIKHHARCPHPDHDDSTPSWYIRDEPGEERHGQHHCAGCSWGGWPVHLVEAVLGCDRDTSKEWLRDMAKPLPQPLRVEVRVGPVGGRQFALPFGVDCLGDFDHWTTPARRYALSRGLRAWQVKRWGIGYAAVGELAGRLVMPARSSDGRVLTYSARSFDGRAPKYMTPALVENPDLGAVFGEEHWPPPGKRRILLMAEGALNAMALERTCQMPIGGMHGSEPMPAQVGKLATWDMVLFAVDNDKAGDKVFGALGSLARWLKMRRVLLPAGQDCNDVALRAPAELAERVRFALDGE